MIASCAINALVSAECVLFYSCFYGDGFVVFVLVLLKVWRVAKSANGGREVTEL